MELDLSTDAPPSPERTLKLAETLAEITRVLNHATLHHDALRYPAEAHQLLRAVIIAVQRLPQLIVQDARWVLLEHAEGRIQVTGGDWEGMPEAAVLDLASRRDEAIARAEALWEALEPMASIMGNLAAAEDDGDG